MLMRGEIICDSRTCTRPGCSPEAGCQGHSWKDRAAAHYHYRLHNLVSAAALDGLTVTIEQRPLFPPRMGHYDTVVTVRESHASYRSKG